MQDPTDPAEASIPPGNGRNVWRMSGTMRRKVAVVQSPTLTQCYERLVLVSDTEEWRNGNWTKSEDVNLTNAVRTYGRSWQAVAPPIQCRTNDLCRKRWALRNACEHETDREFTAE
jgi:hypothetical protein